MRRTTDVMKTGRLRILIVDDEPAHIDAICRSLEDMDEVADVVTAGTLAQYRQAIAGHLPDIVLMDIHLPDGRSVDMLTSPAEAGSFPIVIMTSYGNEKIAVEAIKSGALDYVVKSAETFANMPRTVVRALREWGLLQDRQRADEERHTLERRLQQAQKAESLGRMAGAIAHHYNNLLGAVMGNLEMAMFELPADAGVRIYISEAMDASRRAAEISTQMLSYLGKAIGKRESIDLVKFCTEALPLWQASLPGTARLKTEFLIPKAMIHADAVQLRQALTNLVINAGEAVCDRQGEVAVAVRLVPVEEIRAFRLYPPDWASKDKQVACISVSDTGIGMEPAIFDKLFDPFFSTKFTGRGLGLAVVLGLIGAHGGAIAVESDPGKGSLFRVLLPLLEPDIQQPSLKTDAVVSGPVNDQSLILLVDDEPLMRKMTTAMLSHLGKAVVEASGGMEALEVFRRHSDRIRCVLLDFTMPGMNGWETLAAFRALRPDLPVVLVSGYDQNRVMAAEHSDQPCVFLHKPFRVAELREAIERAECG